MDKLTTGIPLILCAALAAQIPSAPARGWASSFPAGIVLASANTSALTELVNKPGGTGPLRTFTGWPAGVANYDLQAIQNYLLTHHGITTAMRVDGVSSGNDATPLIYHTGGSGQFWAMPELASAWAAIFVSVNANAVGATGGWINYRHQNNQPSNPQSTGAEILGLYFDGSLMPDHMPGNVFLEASADDMQNGTVTVPSNPDIVAFDWPIGLLHTGNGEEQPGISELNRLYFTVTQQCALAWAAEVTPGSPIPSPGLAQSAVITGATVFCAEYGPAGQLTDITIIADHASLNLPLGEDIDALAIGFPTDTGSSLPVDMLPLDTSEIAILFSLAPGTAMGSEEPVYVSAKIAQGDPLLGGTRQRQPLRRKNGASITSGAKILAGDNIDAICTHDPEAGTVPSASFGTPELSVTNPQLGFSMNVDFRTTPNTLLGVASGWPTTGAQASAVFLLTTTDPSNFALPPTIWETCPPTNGEPLCPTAIEFLGVRQPGQATFEFTRNIATAVGPLSAVVVQVPIGSTAEFYSLTLALNL